MSRPVILCGFGKVGRYVVDCLNSDEVSVVVIDLKEPSVLPAKVRFIAGDCRQKDVLVSAGVRNARGIVVCTSDELVNMATAIAVRSLAPDVRLIVRAFNPKLVPRLGKSMSNVIALSVSALAAPLLAQVACSGSALGAIDTPRGLRPLAELEMQDHSSLAGQEIARAIGSAQAVCYMPVGGAAQFLNEIDVTDVLTAGDRLVVCADESTIAKLTGDHEIENEARAYWANWPRRLWRTVAHTLRDVERPVRIASMILVALLVCSTLIYWSHGDSLSAGFYHTISVMGTGSDLHAENQSPAFQTFVSFLKLAGALLLAAFTAILTNYLVRARLAGALEMRRIPDGGHVVVCGLGNVGFRVVEELIRMGQAVVIVESNRDNSFLSTARQLGAAVVTGNCTLPLVLKQARVETARSVICSTSSDLANVEAALLVREMKPSQRVVVRLSDTEMAKGLREAAEIRLAVSVPALAAPAFAAALYGDKLGKLFFIGGRMLTSVEINVEKDEPGIDGSSVAELMQSHGLIPIHLQSATGQTVSDWTHRMSAGDRLIAILALGSMDQLYWRDNDKKKASV